MSIKWNSFLTFKAPPSDIRRRPAVGVTRFGIVLDRGRAYEAWLALFDDFWAATLEDEHLLDSD